MLCFPNMTFFDPGFNNSLHSISKFDTGISPIYPVRAKQVPVFQISANFKYFRTPQSEQFGVAGEFLHG